MIPQEWKQLSKEWKKEWRAKKWPNLHSQQKLLFIPVCKGLSYFIFLKVFLHGILREGFKLNSLISYPHPLQESNHSKSGPTVKFKSIKFWAERAMQKMQRYYSQSTFLMKATKPFEGKDQLEVAKHLGLKLWRMRPCDLFARAPAEKPRFFYSFFQLINVWVLSTLIFYFRTRKWVSYTSY